MTQQERLDRLADRGEPVGADRMIERIEAELAGAPLVRVGEQALESAPHPTHRPVVVAVVAALVVGALGIGSWLIGPILPADMQAPPDDPLELATGDGLWPTVDMVGSPESIAIAFAESVLGWAEVSARIGRSGVCFAVPLWQGRGESCGEEATAVVVSAPAEGTIEVVTAPIGRTSEGRLWVVVHVGDGYPVDLIKEAPEGGSRLPVPAVAGAVSAEIALHSAADLDDVVHLTADRDDLAAGSIDTRAISDPRQVLAVLVRYRDADGAVITAKGGPRNMGGTGDEWDPPAAAGPDVVLAEGTYVGSDLPWTLIGHVTEDGGFCMGFGTADGGCMGIPSDSSKPAIGQFQTSGGDGPWCVSGHVTQGSSVELRFGTGADIRTEVVTHPEFPVRVFASCGAHGPPPVATAALGDDGTVLAVVETRRTPETEDAQPPLIPIEQNIVDALAQLSIEAVRAEMPGPDPATMWIPSDSEAPLQITAHRGPPHADFVPVEPSRDIGGTGVEGGVVVETVEFRGGGRRWEQFMCDGYVYRVTGEVDGYETFDAFLRAFIDASSC